MNAGPLSGGSPAAVDRHALPEGLWASAGPLLFLAIFLFFWISLAPFSDLSDPKVLLPNVGGDVANQAAALLLSAATLLYALQTGPRRFLAVLSPALLWLLAWMAVSAAISSNPALAGRKLVLAMLIILQAAVLLLAPSSRRQFAMLLALGVALSLAASLLGILFIPERAIHQITELIEPQLAGDWRGAFAHKNVAGAACALMVLIGLFVRKAYAPWAGLAIVAVAGAFLVLTGSKTPVGILPVSLLVSAVLLRVRSAGLRIAIALGVIGVINLLTVGSALLPGIRSFIELIMTDATFTDRTAIWRFSAARLLEQPITGFGFQAFWGTSDIFNSGGAIETWAVRATGAHNGYLEMALNAGLPGLLLFLLWFVVQPARDLSRSEARGADAALNTLFVRIWVYAMISGCLESEYFVGGGPVWIMALMAVLGLRLQARADLVSETDRALPSLAVGT